MIWYFIRNSIRKCFYCLSGMKIKIKGPCHFSRISETMQKKKIIVNTIKILYDIRYVNK